MEHAERYVRLTVAEREEVSRLLAGGGHPAAIARRLSRHRSTISRELWRNRATVRSYRASDAQERADGYAHGPRKPHRMDRNDQLRTYVLSHLRLRRSPWQIAQRMRIEYADDDAMRISHEAIYQWIAVQPRGTLKRELARCLRQGRATRKHRSRMPERRGKMLAMVSIEEQPPEIANRNVPGHWEGDLLVGKRNQSALGTIVERTTRFTLLAPLRS